MKNPNGYGSVVKLKGNRRKPYAVRKTKGWNNQGHPVYSIIGYCTTREEGMILLAQYNKDPWDVDLAKITFEDLFALWKEKKAIRLGKSNQKLLFAAFHHCRQLHKMQYKAIKSFHMQDCIDNCIKGYATRAAIKNFFRHLDKLALEIDIINRCYSELLTSDTAPETTRMPFTDEEIDKIWGIKDMPWVDSVLVFLYTGFRISELLDLRLCNIDLEEGTMQGGMKTRAGKDRIVSIHPKIMPFVEKRMQSSETYLFEDGGKQVSDVSYYKFWNAVMGKLKINRTPHECRHTFISRLDSAGANRRCIDLLAGHKSKEVGERVYTHKTLDELRETVELLP